MFRVKIRCLNVTIWFTRELKEKVSPKRPGLLLLNSRERREVVSPRRNPVTQSRSDQGNHLGASWVWHRPCPKYDM